MTDDADCHADFGLAQTRDDPAPKGIGRYVVHADRRWRYSNLVWLVYSAVLFIEPVQRNTALDWLLFAGAYGSFLTIYVWLISTPSRRRRLILLLALAALGAAYYPRNAVSGCMFTYAASMIPFASESLALTAAAIGAAALMAAGEGVLLHVTPWYWGMFSVFAICAGASNTVVAQRMRSNERLDLAQEQIEHLAKVAERERIARDLHDVLGHTLSVVVLKSELAGKLMARDAARARREIGEVEQIARKALGEVREAISGYRAAGLAAEIERARQALDAAGITLECAAAPPRLQPAHDSVLSLVLREAVTNIIRHAGATRCRLEFAVDGGRTRLLVHDDGRGRIELEGNGLRGMRERVESLGGLLAIDSRQGTLLRIEIPTAAPASA